MLTQHHRHHRRVEMAQRVKGRVDASLLHELTDSTGHAIGAVVAAIRCREHQVTRLVVIAEERLLVLDLLPILELIKFGENKAEGNNLGPLTDSARAHMQEMVDTYGNAFERAVARGRGIKQEDVHKKFGQGRVFDAKQAVGIGMADRVGTLADVLSTPALSISAHGRQARFAAMRHQLSIAAMA